MSPSPSSTPPPPSPDSPNVQQADSHPPPPPADSHTFADQVLSTMLSIQFIQQKLGLAKHVLTQTAAFIDSIHQHAYFPLDITHTSDSHTNTICRISCFSHLSSHLDEARLTDRRQADSMGGRWGNSDTIPHVACGPPSVSDSHDPTAVPGWLFRRVAHTLSATTAWCHPCCWLTACHISLCDRSRCLINSSPHACVQWTDGASSLHNQPEIHPSLPHVWMWAPASEVLHVRSVYPDLNTIGWYNRRDPIHLMCSPSALHACEHTQILRLHVLLQHEGTSQLSPESHPQSHLVLRALATQTGVALDHKNLGAWASCFSSAWPTSHLPLTPPSVWLDASVTSTHGMWLSHPQGQLSTAFFTWLFT